MIRRSFQLDIGAGCLLITVGILHSVLTTRSGRAVPQLAIALGSSALMVVAGVGHATSVSIRNARMARLASRSALVASIAGIIISLGLIRMTSGALQALSQLMMFGIATRFVLTRPAV